MGSVSKFPIKGTKIKAWFDEASGIADVINETAALDWIRKHVPSQFHKLMFGNLRVYLKQKKEKK
jgi:hypothetical protein